MDPNDAKKAKAFVGPTPISGESKVPCKFLSPVLQLLLFIQIGMIYLNLFREFISMSFYGISTPMI